MTPKVSILIPVYNVEKFLPRCLDSLMAQTMTDIEIIAVNDASPDGSPEILREYAARDSRIVIVDKTVNEGPMMARSTGIGVARGEWIFFLDSDDYIPADTIERLYERASRGDADIVVGNMYLENLEGRHVLKPRAHVAGNDGSAYLKAILTWTTCSMCGSLYDRRLLTDPELPTLKNQLYSEDRILLTAILVTRHPRVAVVDTTSYYYCLNQASATRVRLTDAKLRSQLEALSRCHRYVEEKVPQFRVPNDNFLLRYLSLYIEKGYPVSTIRDFNPTTTRLLGFREMCRVTSTRFALHTWLSMRFPPYRMACTVARSAIRRIQGKD